MSRHFCCKFFFWWLPLSAKAMSIYRLTGRRELINFQDEHYLPILFLHLSLVWIEYLYTLKNQHDSLFFYACRGQTFTEIPVIRIAEYINDVVAKRKVPANRNGSVIMKIDVEVRTDKIQMMWWFTLVPGYGDGLGLRPDNVWSSGPCGQCSCWLVIARQRARGNS